MRQSSSTRARILCEVTNTSRPSATVSDRSATMHPSADLGGTRQPLSHQVSFYCSVSPFSVSICLRSERRVGIAAGEHEYIDVIIAGERLLVDVDFRAEFQIARSTKGYTAVLQSLPSVFVGKEDRVGQIVAVVSEAARLSLNKDGLHFPPWRKPEYMRSKWLAPYERYAVASDAKQAALDVAEETSGTVALAEKYYARRLGVTPREPTALRVYSRHP